MQGNHSKCEEFARKAHSAWRSGIFDQVLTDVEPISFLDSKAAEFIEEVCQRFKAADLGRKRWSVDGHSILLFGWYGDIEEPVVPNIHIAAGATLVGYSGGKCLRGPQSSGMLIGQKDLCNAAYYQASPHHCYGRALKCSKEEAMGLLAAVQQWYKRDHAAEQREWRSWLKNIENRLKPLQSTSFEYLEPADLSNKAPELRIRWDANVLRVTGTELVARLDAGTPRIIVNGGTGSRPEMMESSVTIMPYMMDPGEDRIIANAISVCMRSYRFESIFYAVFGFALTLCPHYCSCGAYLGLPASCDSYRLRSRAKDCCGVSC